MGHGLRDVVYRARQDSRQNRLGWLLLISAINLMLWSGLIALITRAA